VKIDDLAPWLFGRTADGIRWGLERTEELLAGVGDPHRRFRSLLIGGTNGKGSVAALCESALRGARAPAAGVGLYTSPHLVSFTERIRINGDPVDETLLLDAAERLRPAIERTGATFFEATTAIAFLCFAEARVDTAVVEVGLGGRLDATNVLRPVATAVTNIARDHVQYLGESLQQIAAEKAGIFKVGIPAVVGETDPALLAVLRERAEAVNAPLVELDRVAQVDQLTGDLDQTSFRLRSARWGEHQVQMSLAGAHQARNAALAAELLGVLPDGLRPRWDALQQGFAGVRWPGRLQVVRKGGPTWIFDVAHNPAGVAVLARALDALDLPRPVVLLAGILSDKEWDEMLPPLLSRVQGCILSVAPTAPAERRWNVDQVASSLNASIPVRTIPDFRAALDRATTLAPHGSILVTGSVHTVGDAMAALGVSPL
jgi:dihydrofolate synthase/folylpolyglutamate synthase